MHHYTVQQYNLIANDMHHYTVQQSHLNLTMCLQRFLK
uniref:Uncharacterized protein n=1 Tax=Arundo donax TaxID=35708 RepID=A0A0A8ZVA9_ARUDO